MSDLDRDPYERAADLGLSVVHPKANELFVDIDDEAGAEQFFRGASILAREYNLSAVSRPSPSGEPWHFHVVVTVVGWPAINDQVRVALQALLGSDPVREALSWIRALRRVEPVSVFFEKPPVIVKGEPVRWAAPEARP